PGLRRLWQAAADLLPDRRVGDFNQALMELGALVCTSTAPHCGRCPLAGGCAAHRLGLQESIPRRPAPPRTVEVREVAVVVAKGKRVLLAQRPSEGRWGGMWEFPHGEVANGVPARRSAGRSPTALGGVGAGWLVEFTPARHTVDP